MSLDIYIYAYYVCWRVDIVDSRLEQLPWFPFHLEPVKFKPTKIGIEIQQFHKINTGPQDSTLKYVSSQKKTDEFGGIDIWEISKIAISHLAPKPVDPQWNV